jgi:hypothetical protein
MNANLAAAADHDHVAIAAPELVAATASLGARSGGDGGTGGRLIGENRWTDSPAIGDRRELCCAA